MSAKQPPAHSLEPVVWNHVHSAIEAACAPNPLTWAWLSDIKPPVQKAVEIMMLGRVSDAQIVMFDRTPMVRVILRHQGKTYKVDKSNPLLSLIERKIAGSRVSGLPHNVVGSAWSKELSEQILSFLPQNRVAAVMADIANAAAKASQDPKKLAPIRARLNAKRMADKERLKARIREVFHDHDDLLSEDDVIQIWRETMCREIMDS